MVMLNEHNKIYGSLGIQESLKTITKIEKGTGQVVLTESIKAPFEKFELFGNSAQGENPSIEFPKEIKNSGKYDETSGKYLIDVNVTGKNLFNPKSKEYIQSAYRSYKVNKKKGTSYITITLTDKGNNADISGVSLGFSGNDTSAYGEKATEYEPYTEQTITIPLDKPLTKWDKIEKRDDVWGVACQTGRITLTGSDEKDGGKWYEGHNNLYSQYHIEFADNRVYYKRGEYENYAYCNVFKAGTLLDRGAIDNIIFVTKGVYTAIGICSKRWSNLDGFKKYLQENPLEVIYRTSKEEFIPLPQETQLALNSLHANDGTTIITVDSGEVETGIEVHYKSYGNNVRGVQ